MGVDGRSLTNTARDAEAAFALCACAFVSAGVLSGRRFGIGSLPAELRSKRQRYECPNGQIDRESIFRQFRDADASTMEIGPESGMGGDGARDVSDAVKQRLLRGSNCLKWRTVCHANTSGDRRGSRRDLENFS